MTEKITQAVTDICGIRSVSDNLEKRRPSVSGKEIFNIFKDHLVEEFFSFAEEPRQAKNRRT